MSNFHIYAARLATDEPIDGGMQITILKCPTCGIEGDGKFCSKCGSDLSQMETANADAETIRSIPLTLAGTNGEIELTETNVRIVLYKERYHLGLGRKWDISKNGKVREIPRDVITKVELAKALGKHQLHVHFPGAGLLGFVNIFIKVEQIPEAAKMIKQLNGIDTPIEIDPIDTPIEIDPKVAAIAKILNRNDISPDKVLLAVEGMPGCWIVLTDEGFDLVSNSSALNSYVNIFNIYSRF